MIKKIIILLLVALVASLLCTMIIPSTVVAEKDDVKKTSSMTSLITIDWDTTDEPIVPFAELRKIDLNITYSVTKGGVLANLLFPFYKGKQVNINLDIGDMSKGCTATLAVKTLTTVISDEPQELTTTLSVSVDETAPAYGSGYVKCNVSVDPFKGPFGLITYIDGFEQEFTVKFKPAYLPLVVIELPQGNFYEIAPFNETEIPITITNLGNAKTKVFVEVENASESFNIFLNNVTLDFPDGEKTIYMTVIADNKFDKETIKLKFTPARDENIEDKGDPKCLALVLENDGSYIEEENGIEIDTTTILIILVIIILFIAALILLKKKKE